MHVVPWLIPSVTCKVLTPEKLTVSRDDPLSLSQFSSDVEFIVVSSFDEPEGNKWETFFTTGGHNLPVARLLQGITQVDCVIGQILHDALVSSSTETDQLVVLSKDLRCSFREV